MIKQFPSLTEAFFNYFDVDLVTTPRQLEFVERIRYRVYCREFGYEPAESFPDLRESDQYDSHSLHSLITHRRSGRPAGCVRLICASDEHSLPVEDFCAGALHLGYLETLAENRNTMCEVSRLAVDYSFRKRPGEQHTRVGEYDAFDCCHQEQRTFSLIGIAAFLSAFALADLAGRSQGFAMMESNLPRWLRMSGVCLEKAGDPTEYHGRRTPYFVSSETAITNIRDDLRKLYLTLEDRIAAGLSRARLANGGSRVEQRAVSVASA
ncbi:PEP-CTERM/exosortase system-associated acyltransferase [Seongchinamella sediminis]|uniref:PEP-CTERM/exosortase system-associated acyltransferase n=1 Tax=Seongchinamella sediminis TaxID=2283635 RepID=A0A3L7DY11_9GAMM|nr:PEP-CTERM/exosortase system-associated acyltransferase [Seongchinamella sediminis]RLQ20732.1 PEP-CTERM/exosortase system-associated acyltransferase [Seongchinamella sediminis]